MHILKCVEDCKSTQDSLLENILRENQNTEYGQKFKFKNIKERDQYIVQHPLVKYEQFRDYIERIAAGENNLLSKAKVVFLSLTSGTTGHHKMYPIIKENKGNILMALALMYKYRHLALGMKRTFDFKLYPQSRTSPAGIPMGAITVYLFKPAVHNVVPKCFSKLTKEYAAFYAQSLFILAEEELGYMQSFSTNLLYSFFKFIENNWSVLCDAIEKGYLPEMIPDMPEDVRQELNENLTADPARAAFLRQELSKGMEGMAQRIWPCMTSVCTAKSGGFALSAQSLQAVYCKGLPLFYLAHAASEGTIGCNIEEDVEEDIYTLLPTICFQEFIPQKDMDKECPRTLFMDQVSITG